MIKASNTKQHGKEPMKMVEIQMNSLEIFSVDFGGLYPDGHYNLVIIDKKNKIF